MTSGDRHSVIRAALSAVRDCADTIEAQAGGMLAGVPSEQAQACVQMLKSAGFTRAAIIGEVLAPSDALEPVLLRNS